MPPKRGNTSLNRKKNESLNTSKNGSIVNMFKRIESNDSNTLKCEHCKLLIKSCLLADHVNTKCQAKMKLLETERRKKEEYESDIIFINEVKSPNDNKKLKISVDDDFKIKAQLDFKNFNNETDYHSTPKKTCLDESRFSIYENELERSKYVKDEKETPVKNENMQTGGEAMIEENFVEEFDAHRLVLNLITDTEEETKLAEIQESNIKTSVTSLKRNIAKKSTATYKYNMHVKENVPKCSDQTTITSSASSSEDFIYKLNQEDCFSDETVKDLIENNEVTTNPSICYALKNFINAIETVFDDKHFVYLLNEEDLQIVNSFNQLNGNYFSIFTSLSLVIAQILSISFSL
jgi:hypothetical protein